MIGWMLAIMLHRAAIRIEEPPKPEPQICICIYNIGCGSFHPEKRACECPVEE